MISKQAVELAPLPSPGFYSLMFVVPKVTGGWRPIIDLSTLNDFISKKKFRMETPATALQFLRQGDWTISLDLKDAYFQVPIHPRSRHLLRFSHLGQVWQFRALPFGLTTAPYVFTRVMAHVSSLTHARGIRMVRYIDDWLVAAEDQDTLCRQRDWLLALCCRLGILVNFEKSDLSPSQSPTYLGMDVDTASAVVRPSSKRLARLSSVLQEFSALASPPALLWLRLLGHMASVEKLTHTGRSRMRLLQLHLQDAWSPSAPRHAPVQVTQQVREDLSWWADHRNLTEGVPLHSPEPDLVLFTDASSSGWGAHLGELRASGIWTPVEARAHINSLELRAVALGLQHFLSSLHSSRVRIMSDNSTVVAHITHQGGTHSKTLCLQTLDLLSWARSHDISLSARFIPGDRNVIADALSRRGQIIGSEWILHSDVCRRLWKWWGRPHVDLFATRESARLPAYMSPLPDPQALATDALSASWCNLSAYAFPPFALVRRALNKIRDSQNLTVIFIAPWWPPREWFPDLLELCVDHPLQLPSHRHLLKQPGAHRFHESLDSLALHGFLLSSDVSAREDFHEQLLYGSPSLLASPQPTSTSPSGRSSVTGWRSGVLPTARSLPQ